MPLLNYTTTVAASRSIDQIQRMLADAGAASIATDYTEGHPTAVAFSIDTSFGRRTFRLPVNAEQVHAVLLRQRVQPRYSTIEHAERVAWRIVKDWLEAQLAIVRTEMVGLDQVMLPYMATDEAGTTVYELYASGQQPALGPGT